MFIGYTFLLIGILHYFEDGITTGNYGLIAIPIGFGVAISYTIKFISEGDTKRDK